MFVVVCVVSGLFGEREREKPLKTHAKLSQMSSEGFSLFLLVALQLIYALDKQNRQLRRPSLCTDPLPPPLRKTGCMGPVRRLCL